MDINQCLTVTGFIPCKTSEKNIAGVLKLTCSSTVYCFLKLKKAASKPVFVIPIKMKRELQQIFIPTDILDEY